MNASPIGQQRSSKPELQATATEGEVQELKDEVEEIKAAAKVKDKHIKHLVEKLEHLHNSSQPIKEDFMFKSMSIKMMSNQVGALVEEVSIRDDLKDRFIDLQNRFQSSAKEKQSFDQQFKSNSEDLKTQIDILRTENKNLQLEISSIRQ